jgi:hypothetical protein
MHVIQPFNNSKTKEKYKIDHIFLFYRFMIRIKTKVNLKI